MLRTGVGHSWWSVQFYQQNDGIDFGSGASIDDLLTGDCTIECWFVITAVPSPVTYLLTKNSGGVNNGWRLFVNNSSQVAFLAYFAGNDINITTGAFTIVTGTWYHVALDYDSGTQVGRLFVDGILRAQGTSTLAYDSAAAQKLICNGVIGVGTVDDFMKIGPIRLSSSRRYTGASFTPPQPPHWPANDANAQLITRMNDGAGVVATDYSGNGNNGTITFGANTRWYNDPNVRLG